ncbi:uncharacterized protein LOC120127834 isoform X2 [Hibiscus syriacus]|uniref:uncharacterized protein LOC120127834 isoform X2 n=1 Tax=Hibiscus syriacus TaxID=106335 RepID=UPI0019239C30|nr:uncharacterized protein LOC120127834 isoform X2 [Hibiscus syriacus]
MMKWILMAGVLFPVDKINAINVESDHQSQRGDFYFREMEVVSFPTKVDNRGGVHEVEDDKTLTKLDNRGGLHEESKNDCFLKHYIVLSLCLFAGTLSWILRFWCKCCDNCHDLHSLNYEKCPKQTGWFRSVLKKALFYFCISCSVYPLTISG